MHRSDLVDVNEGARVTGLRPQTIYRLARKGHIRSFRVLRRAIRFDRAELMALVGEKGCDQTEAKV
jgi:excisionase family DNA binding protein